MSTDVPFVDLQAQFDEIAADVMPELTAALRSAAYIGGQAVGAFERAYADLAGSRHCVGLANGTDAVEFALRAVSVGPGAEVILPANTFVATAEAVVRCGATPVLVDVDERCLLMDPEMVAAAVTPRTRAVVPVHLYGQAAPVEEIARAVEGRAIAIVEDAAQAQGATRWGRPAGSLGDVAATSFYPGKNLGAAGDAGAVTTSDDVIARTVRLLGNHGSEQKYVHEIVGFNSRLDTVQAIVLGHKLRRLGGWNAARRTAADRYDELLADVPEVIRPSTMPGNEHVWHLYVVRVRARDEVLSLLHSEGIGAGIHYPVPLHRTAPFAPLARGQSSYPISERAAETILSLPMHPHLTADQQERVVKVLGAALEPRR